MAVKKPATISTAGQTQLLQSGDTLDGAIANLTGGTAGQLPYQSAANTTLFLGAGATTTILVGGGAAVPVWTTATGTGAPARAGSPTFTGTVAVAALTATGLVLTPLSATGSAGFRLPHGAAPTTPTNGDVWTTTAGMYARINAVTVGPFGSAAVPTGTGFYRVTAGVMDAASVAETGTGSVMRAGSPTTTGTLTAAAITASGTVTASQNFVSSTAATVLATTGAGIVYLRPNGPGSATGEVQLGSDGLLTATGTNAIIKSVGTGGYGSFLAQGSGTNASYLFLQNVTNGELGRITGTTGSMAINVGVAATVVATFTTTSVDLAYKTLITGSGDPAAPQNYACRVQGSYGGGYALIDGAGYIGMWSQGAGTELRIGFGSSSSVTQKFLFTSAGDLTAVGLLNDAVGNVRVAVQNLQNAAYTLVAADSGKSIGKNDAVAYTYTIPANATVAYTVGTMLTFFNDNATSNITIGITTDTMYLAGTTTTGSRTLAPRGMATALKVSPTVWLISGSGLS